MNNFSYKGARYSSNGLIQKDSRPIKQENRQLKCATIGIICSALLMSMFSCQSKEKCVFYVHIYESDGNPVTSLGPFGNEDAATDEADDYIHYMGEVNYSYKVELKTKSGCKESEK